MKGVHTILTQRHLVFYYNLVSKQIISILNIRWGVKIKSIGCLTVKRVHKEGSSEVFIGLFIHISMIVSQYFYNCLIKMYTYLKLFFYNKCFNIFSCLINIKEIRKNWVNYWFIFCFPLSDLTSPQPSQPSL